MTYWSDLDRHGWDELWQNHPAVRARINRLATGDPRQWPIACLREVVPDRLPFARALSVGCGVGNLERSLIELGLAGRVTGIDASAKAVEEARRRAGVGPIDYVVADAREYLESARGLDAVLFHSSLHHFDRLPELLGLVRAALAPRGILYLDEYVGPSRDEWTLGHLARWNMLYWRLPAAVRRTKVIRRPINLEDPTEAIESSGILPAVHAHFRILALKDYGGSLLAPIYPSLRRPGQPGGPAPEVFAAAVARLIEAEEALRGRGPGDNAVVVAEPR
jgi:SAM-dependent methyltransferase